MVQSRANQYSSETERCLEKKGGNHEKCFFVNDRRVGGKRGEHGAKKEGFREGGKKGKKASGEEVL